LNGKADFLREGIQLLKQRLMAVEGKQ